MKTKLALLVAVGVLLFGIAAFFKIGNVGTAALWALSGEGKWLLPLVGVAALIDSINPCAFGILLLTISFLFSIGSMRSSIFKIGGAYILGLFVVYILIGLGILQALHLFNTPHFMAKVGASLLIILGSINLLGEFFPSFPIKFRIPQGVHRNMAKLVNTASLPASFLLGALVGLCEFPCTGGPYLMVLGLLHDYETYLAGAGYLLLYNVIFILPLVIILLIASDKAFVGKVSTWKKAETGRMRVWGGIAMIILGGIIFIL